ncbi:hypothetical protein AKJ39_01310 [candidate division MSBL1 archaeon SCGC-AAA259J03]|uniref:Uncharacterized protein n=1 Tax=candidate division MSBL1 archaeon SCGC-AAA259J03 TaxID=1698269 RepID=A0A656YWS9_9EURY|nr:hypothetical protein AKJ39_01310 [candidate division MSBL1 archaeon SCGC-AAA259J03]
MNGLRSLTDYREIVGEEKVSEIYQKAGDLCDKRVLNVNSTYYGGGVAATLKSLVPLLNDAGISVDWRTVRGSRDFFRVTKKFHNALQGEEINFTDMKKMVYETTNRGFSRFARIDHDLVVVHDPQPLPLIDFYEKNQPWVWRCHVDLSGPNEEVWRYLRSFVLPYNRVIYQLEEFAPRGLSKAGVAFNPAIDPLATKNEELPEREVDSRLEKRGIDPDRCLISQISRFDKWKDPMGVLEVFKRVKENNQDCQLAMIGGIATDDPEGQEVHRNIEREAEDMEDVHVIVDAPDIFVNAVQSRSDVVLQMSVREGFGLAATEALWKGTPVVATDVGGLKTQVQDGENGFLVEPGDYDRTVDRVLALLDRGGREMASERVKETVKDKFLITRLMEDWIDLWRELLL